MIGDPQQTMKQRPRTLDPDRYPLDLIMDKLSLMLAPNGLDYSRTDAGILWGSMTLFP